MIGDSSALAEALGRFEGLYPDTIELSLGRVLNALELLGRPQDRLPPVIHVAGTNGKGSTCAFMRAMMEAAGLSVHVFTSPHLVRFNERIRLAGEIVDDARLIDWLERTHDAIKGQEITQFEATTATALLAFSEVPADVLILEVGLGGSYDATNVIDQPALSVITPIDFDHKAFLGSDIRKIAGEKAGIIKSGRPALTAIQRKICDDVIAKRAEDVGAPLYRLKAHFIDAMPEDLGLLGEHQRANAALAAMAVQLFGNSTIIDQNAIFEGARNVVWPARMQRLKDGPLTALAPNQEIWLDGGHNPHAARAIARQLNNMPGRTALVAAMLASKDATGYFMPFRQVRPEVFTLPNAPGHQGAEPQALAEAATNAGLKAAAYDSLEAALKAAATTGVDRILICGSLYLAGEVLAQNGEPPA
ncbi:MULTISPECIES: bifunctional folylpolyglutamate synthase/dihydrofolate synthase [unclassified Hyphomonas]|uniref:tetrahydrofolate synthase n=3 Tax=root TaxID=1 RepID=A0A160U2S1_9ZZZZ|nr:MULTISPECIES: folylpolyglutamate synthase/dihydrofolate synthase family protein [unclassified Hyphomonas]MAL43983.1 bifunctional folylpolyglutamate synthase/dihydrofolate synthase [Hyphomonas sp.]MAX84371.1 bifunctional folylpolyglutamate synthase/dihydrofolate synthase [Hyphomonas sp.]HBJ42735.1 bifunctional folylpolyglutamate synthase/dihydrofolate synthase [Hyphomonas sp.]HBT35514.1 bifunctional folylpolyglutamate synthase/dihydrofolate synthase [Hyphomonas sp.]HBU32828.1 bifunctional fo